ncbi:MAG: hypothetical protein WCV79_02110 [Candidatus Paceibacterota bacterium]
MSKRQWLIIFGVFIMVVPFLGFPTEWNKIFYIVVGLLIIIVSYRMAPNSQQKNPASPVSLPYSEHHNRTEDTRSEGDKQTSSENISSNTSLTA